MSDLIDVVIRRDCRKTVAAALAETQSAGADLGIISDLTMDKRGCVDFSPRESYGWMEYEELADWLGMYSASGFLVIWSQDGDGHHYAYRFDGEGGSAECSAWEAYAACHDVRIELVNLRVKPRRQSQVIRHLTHEIKKNQRFQHMLNHLVLASDGVLSWSGKTRGKWSELDAFVAWLGSQCAGGYLIMWSGSMPKKDWSYPFDGNGAISDGNPWAYEFNANGAVETCSVWKAISSSYLSRIEFHHVYVSSASREELLHLIQGETGISDELQSLFNSVSIGSKGKLGWSGDPVGMWGYHEMLIEYLTDLVCEGGVIAFHAQDRRGTSWAYKFDGDGSAEVLNAPALATVNRKSQVALPSQSGRRKR